jgi:hypothetical protein
VRVFAFIKHAIRQRIPLVHYKEWGNYA